MLSAFRVRCFPWKFQKTKFRAHVDVGVDVDLVR